MTKENENIEEEQKEVRKTYSCEKCGSRYVYVLKRGEIICRRCSHRTQPKI